MKEENTDEYIKRCVGEEENRSKQDEGTDRRDEAAIFSLFININAGEKKGRKIPKYIA